MVITMIFQALHKLVPTHLSRVLLNLIGHSVLALAREWWSGGIYSFREGLEGGWGTKLYRMPARCHCIISSSGTRTKCNFVHCIAEGTGKCERPLLSVFSGWALQCWVHASHWSELTGGEADGKPFIELSQPVPATWHWDQCYLISVASEQRESARSPGAATSCPVCWKAYELVYWKACELVCRKEGWICWVHRVMDERHLHHPH